MMVTEVNSTSTVEAMRMAFRNLDQMKAMKHIYDLSLFTAFTFDSRNSEQLYDLALVAPLQRRSSSPILSVMAFG